MPELRDAWSRYQVARAAMHNEPLSVQVDLSASIMAAIDAEPTPSRAAETAPAAVRAKRTPWLGRVAVAASVTLAVLGGVRFYNQDAMAQTEQRLPAMTQSQNTSPVVLASYSAQGQDTSTSDPEVGDNSWYELRVPNYLREHAQQAGVNNTESGLSYARAASLEGQ